MYRGKIPHKWSRDRFDPEYLYLAPHVKEPPPEVGLLEHEPPQPEPLEYAPAETLPQPQLPQEELPAPEPGEEPKYREADTELPPEVELLEDEPPQKGLLEHEPPQPEPPPEDSPASATTLEALLDKVSALVSARTPLAELPPEEELPSEPEEEPEYWEADYELPPEEELAADEELTEHEPPRPEPPEDEPQETLPQPELPPEEELAEDEPPQPEPPKDEPPAQDELPERAEEFPQPPYLRPTPNLADMLAELLNKPPVSPLAETPPATAQGDSMPQSDDFLAPQSKPLPEEIPQEELPQEELPQEELPQEEIPQEEIPQEELSQEELSQEEVPQEEIPQEKLSQEEVPQEEIPQEEIPQEKLSQEEPPPQEPAGITEAIPPTKRPEIEAEAVSAPTAPPEEATGESPCSSYEELATPATAPEETSGENSCFSYAAPAAATAPPRTQPAATSQNRLVSGKNAVLEALRSGQTINRVLLAEGQSGAFVAEVIRKCRENNIPYQFLPKARLSKLAGPDHRGAVCELSALCYAEVEDMLEAAQARNEQPLLLLLDGVEDPHNLGAVMRTALCVGAHGIVIPKRRAASFSGTVARTSAGASAYMLLARVSNLSQTARALQQAGLWLAAADREGQTAWQADLTGPLALVLGGEGGGVSPLLKRHCDLCVSLPMSGPLGSLNVSAAAAALLYEIKRQRAGSGGC